MAREHVHVDILLKPFRFWCQKVLPLVYDDSLSYYEVLCKLTKYINELIENMKAISEAFDVIQDEFDEIREEFDYIKTFFDGIKELVDGFNERLTSFEGDFEEFKEWTVERCSELNDYIRLVEEAFNNRLVALEEQDVAFSEALTRTVDQIRALGFRIDDVNTRIDNLPSLNVDDTLSSTSENPVQNKVITAALQGVTPATIDDALSTTSTNPVQNKVITNRLNGLDTRLTDAENGITSLNTGFNSLSGDVSNLQTDMSGVNTNISNLTTRVSSLETRLASLSANFGQRISSLETLVESSSHLIGSSPNIILSNGSVNNSYTITVPKSMFPSDFMVNGGFNGAKYRFMTYAVFDWNGTALTNSNVEVSSSPTVSSSGDNYVFTFKYTYNVTGVSGSRNVRFNSYWAQYDFS